MGRLSPLNEFILLSHYGNAKSWRHEGHSTVPRRHGVAAFRPPKRRARVISSIHVILRSVLIGAAVAAAVGPAVTAAASEPDLATSVEGQDVVHPGDVVTFAVHYANEGSDAAVTPYANLSIPSGVPARIDQLTQQQLADLQASAAGTDTLGNTPLLFLDAAGCEHLFFQLQGPSPPGPVQGLDPGAEGSFRFDLAIPAELASIAGMTITEPPTLAGSLVPALTNHRLYYDDGATRRYGRGLNCDSSAAGCSQVDDCFGQRLSFMPPLTAELQVVDDGGGAGDPALGCDPLVGFAAGRIAVMRRGECSFFDKASRAQEAGAAAALIVNNGQCAGLGPDSPDCIIDMDGGDDAGEIDIPIIMLSAADGERIVDELGAGGTVSATLGARPGAAFELSAFGFLVDPEEVDPNPANNGFAKRVPTGIFADGLETGDATDWSAVVR
jgi:hypothetical protein